VTVLEARSASGVRRGRPGKACSPVYSLPFIIAAAAVELRNLSGITVLSPLIIAIVRGMALHNTVGIPGTFKPGGMFSMRRIQRLRSSCSVCNYHWLKWSPSE